MFDRPHAFLCLCLPVCPKGELTFHLKKKKRQINITQYKVVPTESLQNDSQRLSFRVEHKPSPHSNISIWMLQQSYE